MLTLTRKKKEDTAPDLEDDEELETAADKNEKRKKFSLRPRNTDVTNSWTNGERLKSIASTGLAWVFIGCGPVALFGQALSGDSSGQTSTVQVQDAGDSQRVSEFASTFVTRYLSTQRGNEDQVTSMLAKGTDNSLSLASDPAAPTAVTPGQAVEISDGHWMVTVSSEQPGKKDEPSTLHYWQVPVITNDAGSMAAGALPSMVAAPTGGDLSVDRGSSVSDTDVSDTVTAFMQAYLAGQGEVSPLTSPGSQLSAVSPAPYTEVTVPSVESAQEAPEAPVEGDQIRTQITVTAIAADGTKTQLEYSLDLRYRDRWEVSAVNPTTPAASADHEGAQS
ncbi:conjugal transfer protein [Brachybacterium kimchii]|uniref:Conjugal transfer protein n=1 Tax=Brachybacterium kimchii TaxID=2942909 RepID=A0ABY4NB91_9MICO|nr:conjugal transfer protein [Brachybacterium kimchii]UQN31812.1 conjugal transfer protein [Brachybacterium kimchii]